MLLALPTLALLLIGTGCARRSVAAAGSAPAFGSAIVESSEGKQIGAAGTALSQPVVIQVNDDQNNAVTGANTNPTLQKAEEALAPQLAARPCAACTLPTSK